MFYIKQNFAATTIKTAVLPDNVYSICPECGREFQVDIIQFAQDMGSGEFDLYSHVLCPGCATGASER